MESSAVMMSSVPQFNGLKFLCFSCPCPEFGCSSAHWARGREPWVHVVISLVRPIACDIYDPDAVCQEIRAGTIGQQEGKESRLQTGDPARFTLADRLACDTVSHIIGVGVVLGLKSIGAQ